ncbi:protein PYRICULARIA ORYZAE RESISTANCE 21-like [Iris pallida]|uniref:Protein PYRICULARIA ORYZAE RESISTANCE 21-like n=1 Tax=Iris pallida TaxID=29817 RepID=A0AAX6E802_IRIPA|nr:protein PYRICULARIA ORYZAE RESISTANCE 21-like [Iris pallida]
MLDSRYKNLSFVVMSENYEDQVLLELEKERIQSIYYDEKNQTVTISGPFDPQRLTKKICCKACKVIKDIQIKDNKEKPKDIGEPVKAKPKDKPVEPAKEKPKEKSAAPVESKKEKPKDTAAEPKKDKSNGDGKAKDAKPPVEAAEPKKDKADGNPKPADKPKVVKFDVPPAAEQVKGDPVASVKAVQAGMVYQPAWQGGPVCYGRPGYDGYYGGYCNCGCANNTGYGAACGWIPESQPVVYNRPVYESHAPMMVYSRSGYETQPLMVCSEPAYGAGGGYQTNRFSSEEDAQGSCRIM